MPNEETMRANPTTQYAVGENVLVWFDGMFMLAETSDPAVFGQSAWTDVDYTYETYDELVAAVTALV